MGAFEKDELLANVQARGAQLKAGLESLAAANPGLISEVRGWGLILGFELSEGCGFVAADVVAKLMATGMLTVPAGARVVRLVPPLVVSEAEIDAALAMVADALADLQKESAA